MTTTLEQGYRRLLLAYPRSYRAARGDEMVGTLLDGATPGQVRPRPSEAADLIACGLVQRFGGPSTPGFADGLRIALPISLVAALVSSAQVRWFDNTEPYTYAWAATLALWMVSPRFARVAAVASAVFTAILVGGTFFRFLPLNFAFPYAVLAGIAALAAPPRSATVEETGFGAALWRPPGRIAALLVGLVTAAFAAGAPYAWSDWLFVVGPVAVITLLLVGVAVWRRGGGTGPLWAAAMLSPSLLLVQERLWPFNLYYSEPVAPLLGPQYPQQPDVVALAMVLTTLIAGTVGLLHGPEVVRRGSLALSRATLTGAAAVLLTLDVVGGLPHLAVVVGCSALMIAGLGGGVLPWAASAVLLAGGGAGVLADVNGWIRDGRPWPLFAVALIALVTLLQTPARRRGRWWVAFVWGVSGIVAIAAGTVVLYGHYFFAEIKAIQVTEQPLTALVVPALVAAAVAAGMGAARTALRSALTLVVALATLLAFEAPTRDVFLIGGVTAASTVLTVLAAVANGRRAAPAARPND